jgi:hypothetical protein
MAHSMWRLDYELDSREYSHQAQRPNRLRGPPSLLSNGHGKYFSQRVKLTNHLHQETRWSCLELRLCSPARVNGLVLNQTQRQPYLIEGTVIIKSVGKQERNSWFI